MLMPTRRRAVFKVVRIHQLDHNIGVPDFADGFVFVIGGYEQMHGATAVSEAKL
jgi:hypothetical protein